MCSEDNQQNSNGKHQHSSQSSDDCPLSGIKNPKPIGWKPKNTLPDEVRKQVLVFYSHSFPNYSYSKIARILGVSDMFVRNVVRSHYGRM